MSNNTTPPTEKPSVPFCPLRHALLPGLPSLLPGHGEMVYHDLPCAKQLCAWYWPAQTRCAILQLGIELRALPIAILDAMTPPDQPA